MGAKSESSFSPRPLIIGVGLFLALTALAFLIFAYGFFAAAVWPGDDSGGEALADPDGFVLLGGIGLLFAAPFVFGAYLTLKSSLSGADSQSRAGTMTVAVVLALISVGLVVIGVAAIIAPQPDPYTHNPAWVHPAVAAAFILPGLSGLWLTARTAARFNRIRPGQDSMKEEISESE